MLNRAWAGWKRGIKDGAGPTQSPTGSSTGVLNDAPATQWLSPQ